MADGWIELFDVETDEAEVLFVQVSMDLNQLITSVVFFQWLKLGFFAIEVLLMRSRIFLLTLPISDFVWLMSVQVGLFSNLACGP